MSTVHEIAKILGESLLPLKKATSSTNAFRALMLEMGWRIEEIPAPIADLSARITQLEESLAAISGDGEDAGLYEDLVTAVIELIDAIGDLKNEPFDPTLEALGFPARISERLVNYLLVEYLRTHHSRVNYLLEIFGVVEISYEGETEEASAHKKRELVWKKFADALQDPGRVFQLVFDWGSEEFQDEFLLQILLDLALSLRLPAYLEELDESLRELLGEAADSDEPKFAIHLPILNTTDDDDVEIKAGVHLATVPAAGGGLPGLAILPYLTGEAGESLELADNLYLTVEGSFSFADGVAITLRPGSPVETVQGSSGSGSVASVSGELSLEIRNEDTEGDPILLIGADDGSRFEYKALSLRGGLSLDSAGNADLYLETALEGGLLAVKAGSGDGFLQKVIPADGISTNVDLTVGLSKNNGF
ncbi:MAG: hypothetical protein HYY65_05495, partial [Candidatus Tectomicrobia bacterium]|nr:hypothetical protein [Candidatus Tectomicrobia bacterium]